MAEKRTRKLSIKLKEYMDSFIKNKLEGMENINDFLEKNFPKGEGKGYYFKIKGD